MPNADAMHINITSFLCTSACLINRHENRLNRKRAELLEHAKSAAREVTTDPVTVDLLVRQKGTWATRKGIAGRANVQTIEYAARSDHAILEHQD